MKHRLWQTQRTETRLFVRLSVRSFVRLLDGVWHWVIVKYVAHIPRGARLTKNLSNFQSYTFIRFFISSSQVRRKILYKSDPRRKGWVLISSCDAKRKLNAYVNKHYYSSEHGIASFKSSLITRLLITFFSCLTHHRVPWEHMCTRSYINWISIGTSLLVAGVFCHVMLELCRSLGALTFTHYYPSALLSTLCCSKDSSLLEQLDTTTIGITFVFTFHNILLLLLLLFVLLYKLHSNDKLPSFRLQAIEIAVMQHWNGNHVQGGPKSSHYEE